MVDADNTLYDLTTRDEAYTEMLNYVSKILGRKYEEVRDEFFNALQHISKQSSIEKRKREYALKHTFNLRDDEVVKAVKIFEKEVLEGIVPKPHVRDFLDYVKARGWDVVVFSDEFMEFLKKKLEKAGVLMYVDHIISPEIAGCMKPCKEYYNINSFGYDMSNVVLVVGDDYERDLMIAKKKGLKTAHISNSHGLCEADVCIEDFKSLIGFLSHL